jgi:hypothetical protein
MARVILVALACAAALASAAPKPLALQGFVDDEGAISVLPGGDTVDPYFAMQALLLAQDNGLDARPLAARWVRWLQPRQKPDATFDRFCKRGPVWAPCKTADADDALHALWIRTTHLVAPSSAIVASRDASAQSLSRLFDPARGIYLVSPVYQHGLLIDNVEVWAWHGRDPSLAHAINATFWRADLQRYRVTTQESPPGSAFYPDIVAQVFPLLFDFRLPVEGREHYARWMREHRGQWLRQAHEDFAWGVIALIAWRRRDLHSARCWMRESAPARGGPHWTVTDEAASEILANAGVRAADPAARCD